ncbi:hypothetical protein [Pseudomonas syringae]|uniref:hypothetical protein n=1 Tax=Pseudomonas syringae TaxID=317 RepID=UPI001F40BB92|nr:hypothetical protein [Pseudomonas syringae]MCF5701367.1 hypothetical protein [Pseudomonas syringae]
MKWIFQLLACSSLLFVCAVNAQQTAEVKVEVPSAETKKEMGAVAQNMLAPINNKNYELELLKQQNKLIKEFQSQQQTTVYWALGGVFGLVMILVGASFLTNFRFYEQDKERLKVELDTKLENFGAALSVQMLDYRREADQSVERNSQRVQDIVLGQLSEMRTSLDTIRMEISNDFKGVTEKLLKVDSELFAIHRSLSDAELELRKVELEVWDAKDIPDNMMVTLIQALTAAARASDKTGVTMVYRKMIKILNEKYHNSGLEMGVEVSNYIKRSLDLGAEFDPVGLAEVKKSLSAVSIEKAIT